jgi:hypothetical protein
MTYGDDQEVVGAPNRGMLTFEVCQKSYTVRFGAISVLPNNKAEQSACYTTKLIGIK